MRRKREYVVFPVTVIRDTREQAVWNFRGISAGSKYGGVPLIIPIEDRALRTGDYSLAGYEDAITVERKSKEDLFSTLSQDRERFEREFERMSRMEIAHLVIECEWSEIFNSPPPHTKFNPKSIHGTMTSWVNRYKNVHWHLCPGKSFAEKTCVRLFEKFLREKEGEGAR